MRKGCLCALAVEVLLDRPDSKSADWRWTDGVAVVEVEGGGGELVESDKACSGSGWLPENQKNVVILAIFFAYFRLILQHCLHYFDLMNNESIVLKIILWNYISFHVKPGMQAITTTTRAMTQKNIGFPRKFLVNGESRLTLVESAEVSASSIAGLWMRCIRRGNSNPWLVWFDAAHVGG